jgi:hypothetical protein
MSQRIWDAQEWTGGGLGDDRSELLHQSIH